MSLNKSKSFAFLTGRCPESDGECKFKISTEKILWSHSGRGPAHLFYNLNNVPFAISNPCAIFKGLEREGHENSYCYAARPARRFISDTESVPVQDGFTFLVFVNSSLEIFDWGFEETHPNSKLPTGYSARYKQIIWQKRV